MPAAQLPIIPAHQRYLADGKEPQGQHGHSGIGIGQQVLAAAFESFSRSPAVSPVGIPVDAELPLTVKNTFIDVEEESPDSIHSLHDRGARTCTARMSPSKGFFDEQPDQHEMQHSELTAVPPDSPDKRMDMRLLVPEDDHDGTGSSPVSPSMPPPSESAPTFEDDGPAPPPQMSPSHFGRQLLGLALQAPEALSAPPSEGSKLHGLFDEEGLPACQPCAWFHKKPSGCINGAACKRCHLCPEGEPKLRKKQKVARLRQQQAEAASREAAQSESPSASKPADATRGPPSPGGSAPLGVGAVASQPSQPGAIPGTGAGPCTSGPPNSGPGVMAVPQSPGVVAVPVGQLGQGCGMPAPMYTVPVAQYQLLAAPGAAAVLMQVPAVSQQGPAQQLQAPQQIPAQQISAQQIPAQQISAQQMPAQQIPAQQIPAQQMPAQQMQQMQQIPVQQIPAQQLLGQQLPGQLPPQLPPQQPLQLQPQLQATQPAPIQQFQPLQAVQQFPQLSVQPVPMQLPQGMGQMLLPGNVQQVGAPVTLPVAAVAGKLEAPPSPQQSRQPSPRWADITDS